MDTLKILLALSLFFGIIAIGMFVGGLVNHTIYPEAFFFVGAQFLCIILMAFHVDK